MQLCFFDVVAWAWDITERYRKKASSCKRGRTERELLWRNWVKRRPCELLITRLVKVNGYLIRKVPTCFTSNFNGGNTIFWKKVLKQPGPKSMALVLLPFTSLSSSLFSVRFYIKHCLLWLLLSGCTKYLMYIHHVHSALVCNYMRRKMPAICKSCSSYHNRW